MLHHYWDLKGNCMIVFCFLLAGWLVCHTSCLWSPCLSGWALQARCTLDCIFFTTSWTEGELASCGKWELWHFPTSFVWQSKVLCDTFCSLGCKSLPLWLEVREDDREVDDGFTQHVWTCLIHLSDVISVWFWDFSEIRTFVRSHFNKGLASIKINRVSAKV